MTDDAVELYHKGVACTRANDWEAALELFEQAAALAPNDPKIWRVLGSTAYGLKRWEMARAALTRVIELGEERGEVYGKLAEALAQLRQPAAAARAAERALSFPLNPGLKAYLHWILAYHKAQKGDDDAALRHFHAVVAVYPKKERSLHNLGILYSRRGQFADALRYLTRAAELMSDQPGAWYDLSRVAARAGEFETARAALERVFALGHDDPHTRLELATVLIALGRRKEAARHIRRALRFRMGRLTHTWACALLARCRG